MRSYVTIYYLLFVLLILGAFSSMAQNDYGNSVLGGVAFAFSILFAIQLVSSFIGKVKAGWVNAMELAALLVIACILGLRVFYIHFQFVEVIFGLAGILLIGVYFQKLLASWKLQAPRNQLLAWILVLFYGSILLYIASMTIVPFAPAVAAPAGVIAFGLLIVFIAAAFIKRDLMVAGEKVSAFRIVGRLKDRSVVLITTFFLFTAYTGLTQVNVLPRLYSAEFPQVYFELVNAAETGKEKPDGELYRHEKFKKLYDEFVQRNGNQKN